MERRPIPSVDSAAEVWDDVLAVLDADGKLLETLSVYDALAASGFPFAPVGRGERAGERWVDLLHCNAAEWIGATPLAGQHAVYDPGNILVTSRHQDVILVVNWPTRRVLWQWGRGELSGPHAATWQDDGKILVFDNGLERRWSRVIEVDPVAGVIVRSYSTPDKKQFFSRVMGACQRLANGNVLIANSAGGQGLELTAGGQPVWTFLGTRRTETGRRVKISRLHRISTSVVDGIVARHR
jgi:outer membrane protein assembly factor BamB